MKTYQKLIKWFEDLPDVLFSLCLTVISTIAYFAIYRILVEAVIFFSMAPLPEDNLEQEHLYFMIWNFFFSSIAVPVVETYVFHKWPITILKSRKWNNCSIIGATAFVFTMVHIHRGIGVFVTIPLAILIPYAYLNRLQFSKKRAFMCAALVHIFQNTIGMTWLYFNHYNG